MTHTEFCAAYPTLAVGLGWLTRDENLALLPQDQDAYARRLAAYLLAHYTKDQLTAAEASALFLHTATLDAEGREELQDILPPGATTLWDAICAGEDVYHLLPHDGTQEYPDWPALYPCIALISDAYDNQS